MLIEMKQRKKHSRNDVFLLPKPMYHSCGTPRLWFWRFWVHVVHVLYAKLNFVYFNYVRQVYALQCMVEDLPLIIRIRIFCVLGSK